MHDELWDKRLLSQNSCPETLGKRFCMPRFAGGGGSGRPRGGPRTPPGRAPGRPAGRPQAGRPIAPSSLAHPRSRPAGQSYPHGGPNLQSMASGRPQGGPPLAKNGLEEAPARPKGVLGKAPDDQHMASKGAPRGLRWPTSGLGEAWRGQIWLRGGPNLST